MAGVLRYAVALSIVLAFGGHATAQEAASERALNARIESAYGMLQKGEIDTGFEQLRQALLDSARTDHDAFTINKYRDAALLFHQNGLNDQAGQLFSEGAQTAAVQSNIKEAADFYLAYAEFRTAVRSQDQHFVPLYSAATNLYKEHYGEESQELIHATDEMATALAGIGQYGTAIDLEEHNYEIALKALGEDHTITWRLANNLGDMMRGLGSPARALEYDKVVLENRTRYYGRNHFNTLVSANNNAQDYLDLGDYPNALKMLELCRDIAEATDDKGNVDAMNIWIDYATLVANPDRMDADAVARMSKVVVDGDQPAVLSIRAANLLADHFGRAGDTEKQLHHLEQAYGIAGHEFTTTNPLAFKARIDIANARAKTDTKAAAKEFAEIDHQMLEWVKLQVGFVGSREVGETMRAMADDMLFDYARLASKDASVLPAFADAARRWPTLATAAIDQRLRIARLVDADDLTTQKIISDSIRLSRISQEVFAVGIEQELGYDLYGQTRALEQKLQEEVDAKYSISQAAIEKPLPTAAELLAPDQAQIQYFITRRWGVDRSAAEPLLDTRLYAIVSRKDKAPTIHDLGDPREMTLQGGSVEMASLRSTRSSGERGAVPLAVRTETFRNLYEKLVAPLAGDLDGAETVFVVPDGQLYAVPFSMLEDGNGKLLEERFAVRLLTSPEALFNINREQKLPKAGSAVLAGGIDYANGSEKGAEPLPGTREEVDAIAGILGKDRIKVEQMTGDAVTETALREKMEHASIAHLATHGAYRSAAFGGASNVDTLWQSEVILSRSGDRHAMKRDDGDGRLYAFELMNWDLSSLDLLVLSACETGRGDETFVGGLRGLPTAINLSGAKRSLLTLWPVDDRGTAEFMVRYYERLSKGETYAGALRATRQDAIAGKLPAAKNSLVWAAFVLFEN